MPPSIISTHANEWGQNHRQEGVLDILKIDKNSTGLGNFFGGISPPNHLVATGLSGAPQKCFQSGPALAKAGPG